MNSVNLIFSGDLILDEPQPDFWLSGIAPALKSGSFAIGHLEVAHTHRGQEREGDVPAPGANPDHLAALKRAGFGALTLAGNHIADQGADGIDDTMRELDRLGIQHCGAGANLAEARRAASFTLFGIQFALLSYNCVGPEFSWAGPDTAGCAYVRVEAFDGGPISPAARLDQVNAASLQQMVGDIAAQVRRGARVIVALHKGAVHTPAKIEPYERVLAHAAIDAGADIVVGHHAHILRGIEFYCGRPIFHGLGNGCVVTQALNASQSHPARAEWATKRKALFGFEPDPAFTLAPFHPDAVNALLAQVSIDADGGLHSGFIPVRVEAPGRPVIATPETGARIAAYVAQITVDAGLPPLQLTQFEGVVRVDG